MPSKSKKNPLLVALAKCRGAAKKKCGGRTVPPPPGGVGGGFGNIRPPGPGAYGVPGYGIRRGTKHGGSFWDSIKNAASKVGSFVADNAGKIHDFAKDKGIASKLAGMVNPALGETVKSFGYGKHRRCPRRK